MGWPLAVTMFETAMLQIGEKPATISIDEFRSRQSRLLSQLRPDDLLIICPNMESTRSNDVHYPYRSSSDMLYLSGWKDPESIMTAHNDGNSWIVTLFVQPKNTLKEIWEGRREGVEGALKGWAIDSAHSIEDASTILAQMIGKTNRVLLRSGINTFVDDMVKDAIERRDRGRQQFGNGPISIEDPSAKIAELRLRKSAAEISQMRHASEISSLAHEISMRHSAVGRREYQLQSVIEGFFSYAGTSGWAYPSIVGCGENATVLHYTVNGDICQDGEIILIDAGAEYNGYAADITRSWPINGKFTVAQKEIYQLVLNAQLAAIDECRVGRAYNAPHEAARTVLAEGLIELGVITQTLDEALCMENGQLRMWYMHNTGHWIGLDVHDVGIYKPNGEPRLLEEGMCLTVEPGLYFGAWRPDVNCPQRYANIGIRIEDDVLVTSSDPDVLTKDCPKTISDLESLIGKDFE